MPWVRKILPFALVVLFAVQAKADFCSAIFKHLPQDINPDPIEQLINWEQTSNTARWHKEGATFNVDAVSVSKFTAKVHSGDDTPDELLKYFSKRFSVVWPRHPYNTDNKVPHFYSEPKYLIPVRFSASRSLFIRDPSLNGFYSVKAPTDQPHAGVKQDGKSDLRNSVIISRRRSEMISQLDQEFGVDKSFEVLTDKLAISDRSSGNGFVIRDLTPLTNGNYFLPAFSVPYAGREIAAHLGVPFDTLWEKYWAKSLGESKAKLLLRYGLEMKTPNAQNMLIELDKNLVPTGRMFFRDISDSSLVGPVAEGLGLTEFLSADQQSSYSIKDKIFMNWENSVWQMNEGGVNKKLSYQWGVAHNVAYRDTIIRELSRTRAGKALFMINTRIESEDQLNDILKSQLGQNALRSYHELLRKEHEQTIHAGAA